MTDLDPRDRGSFPTGFRPLGRSAPCLGDAIGKHPSGGSHDEGQRYLVAGLNYIFKSLDLIPDGIDDLGYMDDAFVLRLAAALAATEDPACKEGVIQRLSDEAKQV